ncbi:MAG: signal peptide peptidase SppA [Phycisphaerae bacterium]
MKKLALICVLSCLLVSWSWGQVAPMADKAGAAESSISSEVNEKIVVAKLDGEITEAPPGVDIGLPDLQLNIFWDQLKLIRMVKSDKTVKALVLLVNQPKLSLAQCQQVAMELDELRTAGKKIFIHADSIPTALFMMFLPADKIAMTPGTLLQMNGLSAQILYYKNLMNKLGIDAEVVHLGKFKLFAEPYTSTQPSRFMDEQVNDLLDDLYGQITDTISKYRKIPVEKVKSILDQGPFMAEQANELGLIDVVAHRSSFLEQVQKEAQGKLVFNYAKTQAPQLKSGLGGLLQIFSMIGSKGTEGAQDKIAIVYVTGPVIEGESAEYFGPVETAGSETMRKVFAAIRKDDKIKAVVVRIDSPGGSSSASEIIWGLVNETAKTKPVITSMGTVAGSGGYYIAAAGSFIFASPATMTGSIGVVAGKTVFKGLLDKIYLNQYTYTRGKHASMFDPFSSMTSSQRQNLTDQMELTLRTFKDRVMKGRKGKIENIDQLATGRIYTGQEGIKLGLVDKIGTLADAVVLAAEKAKVKSYDVVHMPEPKTIPELLLEGLGYKMDPDDAVSSDTQMLSLLTNRHTAWSTELAGLDASLLRRTIMMIKLLQTGSVLTISPFQITLK